MSLTIQDLPPDFAMELGIFYANQPFYISMGGKVQGPFLLRQCPYRLVPIGEYVAWAMLRRRTLPDGRAAWLKTYHETERAGQKPDPARFAGRAYL